jgi:hypothetical protein
LVVSLLQARQGTVRDQWHGQAERLTRLLMAPKDEQPATSAPFAQPAEVPAESVKPHPLWKLW